MNCQFPWNSFQAKNISVDDNVPFSWRVGSSQPSSPTDCRRILIRLSHQGSPTLLPCLCQKAVRHLFLAEKSEHIAEIGKGFFFFFFFKWKYKPLNK